MRYLIFLIAFFISSSCTGQNISLRDSLENVHVEEMRAYFRTLDSLDLPYTERSDRQYQKVKAFIKANPTDNISTVFISWGKYFTPLQIDSLHKLLPRATQELIKPAILHQKIRTAILPGTVFPEMILTDTLNNDLAISSLKGKIVFIDLWESACRPCREEFPHLIKLYEKYKDKGFVVITISLDDDKTRWVNAIVKDKLPWLQFCELKLWPNTTLFNKWGISGIPYNFLIGKDGKLIDREISLHSLGEIIAELLD